MDYQGFKDRRRSSGSRSFPRLGWFVRPIFLHSLYQGPNDHQVTLSCCSLVAKHFTHTFVISLKLELEEVGGDDGFHLVKGWAS